METTTLQPTSVTEQSKYYEFKEGTLTIDILKQLIPNSIMERYEIEFTESIYSQNGTFVIRTKDINKNIYNIGLKTIMK
jgi:hypothetical protein